MEAKQKKKTTAKEKSQKPLPQKTKKIKKREEPSFHHPFGWRWMWMMG